MKDLLKDHFRANILPSDAAEIPEVSKVTSCDCRSDSCIGEKTPSESFDSQSRTEPLDRPNSDPLNTLVRSNVLARVFLPSLATAQPAPTSSSNSHDILANFELLNQSLAFHTPASSFPTSVDFAQADFPTRSLTEIASQASQNPKFPNHTSVEGRRTYGESCSDGVSGANSFDQDAVLPTSDSHTPVSRSIIGPSVSSFPGTHAPGKNSVAPPESNSARDLTDASRHSSRTMTRTDALDRSRIDRVRSVRRSSLGPLVVPEPTSGSHVGPGKTGRTPTIPSITRVVNPLGTPVLGVPGVPAGAIEPFATSILAGLCPERPNGTLVVSGFTYGALRASGAQSFGGVWLSNGLNPSRLGDFRFISTAQIMDQIPDLNRANPPSPAAPNTKSGWVASGDLCVAVSSPTDVSASSAHRLLFSSLLTRTWLRGDSGREQSLVPSDRPDGVIVFRSSNCGTTWDYSVIPNPPGFDSRIASGFGPFFDKPHMLVNPSHSNRVYVVCEELSLGVLISVSNDGGETFSAFAPILFNGNPAPRGFFFTLQVNVAAGVLVMVWEGPLGVGPTNMNWPPA